MGGQGQGFPFSGGGARPKEEEHGGHSLYPSCSPRPQPWATKSLSKLYPTSVHSSPPHSPTLVQAAMVSHPDHDVTSLRILTANLAPYTLLHL